MKRRRKQQILAYAVVVLSTIVCLLLTLWLKQIDDKPSLFLFLGGIMVSSAVGGMLPGLVAVGLSAMCSAYFVFGPTHSFAIEGSGSLIRWVMFQGVGVIIVMLHASRRAAAERFSESENRLRLALDAGRIGVWDYDLEDQVIYLSNGMASLFGQTRRQFAGSFDEFIDCVHPDDRDFFRKAVERTATDKVDYEIDFRVTKSDGNSRWLVMRGRGYVARGTGARRVVGVVSEGGEIPQTPVCSTQTEFSAS